MDGYKEETVKVTVRENQTITKNFDLEKQGLYDLAYVLDMTFNESKSELSNLGFTVTAYSSSEYEATHGNAAERLKASRNDIVGNIILYATSDPSYSLLGMTSDKTYAQLKSELTSGGWSYDGREHYEVDGYNDDIYEYLYSKGKYSFSIHTLSSTGALYAISMGKWMI